MPPEQLRGEATPASDLYGLGALALALLTREDPSALLGDDHRLAWEGRLELSRAGRAFLRALLAARPQDRPDDARAVEARANELTRDLPSDPPPAPPPAKKKPKTKRAPHSVDTPAVPPPRPLTPVERRRLRNAGIVLAGLAVVAGGIAWGVMRKPTLSLATLSEPVLPELYALPVIVDVDGDGVRDLVYVGGVDRGPENREDGEDTWGKENGRFETVVQAIDGKSGDVRYTVGGLDGRFGAAGVEEARNLRVVLAASGDALVIAQLLPGASTIDVVALATGAPRTRVVSGPLTGRGCIDGDKVVLDRPEGGAITVDPRAPAPLGARDEGCGLAPSDPRVADAPDAKATNLTWIERSLSPVVALTRGPHAGKRAVTSRSGELAAVVIDGSPTPPWGDRTGQIDVSVFGVDRGSGSDNTMIRLVLLDGASQAPIASPSLADLTLVGDAVQRVEVLERGVMLVMSDRIALVDVTGKLVFATDLPAKSKLAGYAVADDTAVLALRTNENTVYGFLSKKLAPRFVVLDLATGALARSLPQGPLEKAEAHVSERTFAPVAGCQCALADGRKVSLVYAEDARRNDFLGLVFAFDVDGTIVRLAPYENQRRTRISPPPWIRGEVAIGMACGANDVVVRDDRAATAWALPDLHERWTIDVPAQPGEVVETTLGGATKLRCYRGTFDGARATFDDRGVTSVVVAP